MTQCSICFNNMTKTAVQLSCGHTFCKSCIRKWSVINQSCPLDRKKICDQDMDTIFNRKKKVHAAPKMFTLNLNIFGFRLNIAW